MMLRENNKLGFTLIELLVTVAIIGLLATLSIVALNNARSKARDSRRVADIKNIQTALEMYYNEYGHYPTAPSITNCSVKNLNALGVLKTSGVMSKIPTDPQFKDVHPYRQCYNYLSVGPENNYTGISGLYCGSRRRTDYRWSLLFSTESDLYDFEKDTSNSYRYCVHGDLLPGL